MEPIILLDGVTIQHCGELLFDSLTTVKLRRQCAHTYLRCLEDAAFALILGDGLLISKNLPKVGKESPGLDFCEQFEEKIKYVEQEGSQKIDDFILTPSAVLSTKGWLQGLQRIKRPSFEYWKEFAIRESEAYIWPNFDDIEKQEKAIKKLTNENTSAKDLLFGKNYWVNHDLGKLIPQKLVDHLSQQIYLQHPKIPIRNISEFVKRFIVAHALIFEWYERNLQVVTKPGESINHLPHVTRTTFFSEDNLDNSLWKLKRLIMPRMLSQIFSICKNRDEVLKEIGNKIADSKLNPHREKLREALINLDNEELLKIIRDIEKITSGAPNKSTFDVACSLGVKAGIPEAGIELKREFNVNKDYYEGLNIILRRGNNILDEEMNQAIRIFPELGAE